MSDQISFEDFRNEWLEDITKGNLSTVALGNNFSRKLITQWLDLDESSDDVVYCDGSGDGGIDIACLQRSENGDEISEEGDTWYLIQSKFGSAFSGTGTLLLEAQKVIDTLDGQRTNLSSLAQSLLERLLAFRAKASDHDKLILVFATEEPLNDEQKRAIDDIRVLGQARLGSLFDAEAVSIATIYNRNLEDKNTSSRIHIPIKAQLVLSDEELLVGSVKLTDLYAFLKSYKSATGDIDQLYERNVRRFLGMRGKVNKAIRNTLENEPEKFGLYNNGITFVVEDFKSLPDNSFELIEPYIVNGCQTTRTAWEVIFKKLESGGTGTNPIIEQWIARLEKGMVIIKIVKVGSQGESMLEKITRYTNSQNAVREKDFIALTSDFQKWEKQMAEKYDIFLEIQRGGWDSQKALQRQNPNKRQFSQWVNAFDLIKVFGSGWLGEPGIAFGKNPPFLPNGSVFKRIVNNVDHATSFGVDDLYAAYLLYNEANEYQFGRGAKENSRRQTRFLFYMVAIELLKYTMTNAQIERTNSNITQSLLKVFQNDNQAKKHLLDTAIQVIDEYLTQGSEDSVFEEPTFAEHGGDLNAYLKWEQIGKSSESSPKFRSMLNVYQRTMKRKIDDQPSPFEIILGAINV